MNLTRIPTILLVGSIAFTIDVSSSMAQEVGPQQVVAPFQEEEAPEVVVPASLEAVYGRLVGLWMEGDARGIAQLARDGRVDVVVQRKGVAARLGASQLQYLLQELFDGSEEVSFRFPASTSYDPEVGAGYAVGERVYQEGTRLESDADRVFVGMRSERGHWVLTELRLTVE